MTTINLGRVTGLDAFEVAVQQGFQGTRQQWLESLRGEQGIQGETGSLDGIEEITQREVNNAVQDLDLVLQPEFQDLADTVNGIATERIASDSQWITVNDSRQGKIVDRLIEGRSLVNLWSDNPSDFHNIQPTISIEEDGSNLLISEAATWNWMRLLVELFKPNTTYTWIIDLFEFDEGLTSINFTNTSGGFTNILGTHTNPIRSVNTLGRHIFTMNTMSTFPTDTINFIGLTIGNPNGITGLRARFKISIYEGDLTNLTLNHTLPRTFASPNNLTITSMGENLFDGVWHRGSIWEDGIPGPNLVGTYTNFIPVEGGRTVFVRLTQTQPGTPPIGGANASQIFEYDINMNLINIRGGVATGITLLPNTRYIAMRTARGAEPVPLSNPSRIAYDRVIPLDTPHTSQSQNLQYQNEQGEWVNVPDLQGIQVDGNLLVSDEITDTEYIQRVRLMEISPTHDISGLINTDPNVTQANIRFATAAEADGGVPTNRVTSNRLPSRNLSGNTSVFIAGARQHITVRVPKLDENITIAEFHQYLIDNDYKFLVPLTQERRYPVRSWDLNSHEGVTNIHVSSGEVSPRTSFNLMTALTDKIRRNTNNIATNTSDIRFIKDDMAMLRDEIADIECQCTGEGGGGSGGGSGCTCDLSGFLPTTGGTIDGTLAVNGVVDTFSTTSMRYRLANALSWIVNRNINGNLTYAPSTAVNGVSGDWANGMTFMPNGRFNARELSQDGTLLNDLFMPVGGHQLGLNTIHNDALPTAYPVGISFHTINSNQLGNYPFPSVMIMTERFADGRIRQTASRITGETWQRFGADNLWTGGGSGTWIPRANHGTISMPANQFNPESADANTIYFLT